MRGAKPSERTGSTSRVGATPEWEAAAPAPDLYGDLQSSVRQWPKRCGHHLLKTTVICRYSKESRKKTGSWPMGGRRAASFTARDSLSFFSRRPAPAEPFPGSPPVFLLETSMGPSSFSVRRHWASFFQTSFWPGASAGPAWYWTPAAEKDAWKQNLPGSTKRRAEKKLARPLDPLQFFC